VSDLFRHLRKHLGRYAATLYYNDKRRPKVGMSIFGMS
jgi:hypothetical protein